jgi:DNA-binding MarR family transcriptional regulator
VLIIDEVNKINGKPSKSGKAKKYSPEIVSELFLAVIPQAMRLFREEMRENRSGMHSIPQFRILAQLWAGPTSNKELAGRIGVSWAAMSRMVDALVQDGLVERQKSKEDRRQISIRLTKRGQVYFIKVRGGARASLSDRLKSLSQDVVDQLGSGLSQVARGLGDLRK